MTLRHRRSEPSHGRRLQLRRLHDELAHHADESFQGRSYGAGAVEHAANWGNDDMTADDAYYLGGRPWETPQRYLSEGAIYQFGRVTTSTHVVVGAEDIRVAVSQGYLLDRALHSLRVPSTLLVFPGENHALDKNPWHGKIKVREELKWLKTYGGIGDTH